MAAPVHRGHDRDAYAARVRSERGSGKAPVRALIADDDRLGALILARALEGLGLEVAVAHNGDEAWRMIDQDNGFAMAILDWMMPGADGPELCRRIRQDDRRARMHVILLTARDGHADIVAGLDAGADDYLIKPFNP